MKKDDVRMSDFQMLAMSACNGCDLVTDEENKLTSEEVCAAGELTIDDFALCTIDDKEVGVVTFIEKEGKYYWGGKSLTEMIQLFCERYDGEGNARNAYAELSAAEKVKCTFEIIKTKSKNDFVKVTVL